MTATRAVLQRGPSCESRKISDYLTLQPMTDLDADVSDSTFDLRMARKQLRGTSEVIEGDQQQVVLASCNL